MTQRSRKHAGGFTLIEVLVSILIFSFGILGFVGLQARATQVSVSAEDSNRAALMANEIASTLLIGEGSPTPSEAASGAGTWNVTDPTTSAAIEAWKLRVRGVTASGVEDGSGLPNGVGTVTVVSDAVTGSTATISISWRATTAPEVASGVRPADRYDNRFVTQVILP